MPTCRQLANMYEVAAAQERVKNGGSPQERTVQNALKHFRYAVEGCDIGWESPYTDLTPDVLEDYFVKLIGQGKERVSAWTYVSGVQSITAAADKYNGTCRFSAGDGMFRCMVVMDE